MLPRSVSAPPKSVEIHKHSKTRPNRISKYELTSDHSGESPGTSECTDLAHSSSNTVELTTNRSGTGLSGEHTETVTRAELAEAQEDTVDNSEGTNVDGEPEVCARFISM